MNWEPIIDFCKSFKTYDGSNAYEKLKNLNYELSEWEKDNGVIDLDEFSIYKNTRDEILIDTQSIANNTDRTILKSMRTLTSILKAINQGETNYYRFISDILDSLNDCRNMKCSDASNNDTKDELVKCYESQITPEIAKIEIENFNDIKYQIEGLKAVHDMRFRHCIEDEAKISGSFAVATLIYELILHLKE